MDCLAFFITRGGQGSQQFSCRTDGLGASRFSAGSARRADFDSCVAGNEPAVVYFGRAFIDYEHRATVESDRMAAFNEKTVVAS
jgi:hypothetical protein